MSTLKNIQSTVKLAASIIICQLVGISAVLLSQKNSNYWYDTIVMPSWHLSTYFFGTIWVVLYFLLGLSLWLVWDSKISEFNKQNAIILYGMQLFLNFLWSILFFRFHSESIAFLNITVLIVLVFISIIQIYKFSKMATWLLIPYFIWICFEGFLNFKILFLSGYCIE
jgi:tryptophan-rich sensory protein